MKLGCGLAVLICWLRLLVPPFWSLLLLALAFLLLEAPPAPLPVLPPCRPAPLRVLPLLPPAPA